MNVFTLFGELRLNSRQFENALYEADVKGAKAEQSIRKLERTAERLGTSTETSRRRFDKLTEALHSNRSRMDAAVTAYSRGEISQRKFESIMRQTDSTFARLNSRIADQKARLADMPGVVERYGRELLSVSKYAALAGVAVGGFAVKSAMNLEEARNRFTALEGSAGKADERIRKLLNLSRGNVGVNFESSLDSFSFLQSIGTIGERNIEQVIVALGKLQMAFGSSLGPQKDFLINLQQLFDQGFEAQDMKQAVGRVPIFEQFLKTAFGTKDPAALRTLKESGKLTMDSWIAGIAEAANTDTRLAGLRETFGTKLSKALTEINIQLAPLGDRIIGEITPVLAKVTAELQKPNPDMDNVSIAIGERIGELMARGIIEGVGRFKGHIADAFSGKGNEKALIPLADGMREGFIRKLQAQGMFPQKPIFADGFMKGLIKANTEGPQEFLKNLFSLPPPALQTPKSIADLRRGDDRNTIKSLADLRRSDDTNLLPKHTAVNILPDEKGVKERRTNLEKELSLLLSNSRATMGQLKAGLQKAMSSDLEADDKQGLIQRFQSQIDQIAKEAAAKTQETIRNLKEALNDLSIRHNADNPFVQLFADADARMTKLRENTKGLSADLRNSLVQLEQTANSNERFGMRIDSQLEAFNLSEMARQFNAGKLDEDNSENLQAQLQRKLDIITGFKPNLEAIIQDVPRELLGKSMEEILKVTKGVGLVGGGNSPMQVLLPRVSENAPTTEAERAIADRKIIALAQGLNPQDLTADQNRRIADAFEKQAKRELDKEKNAESVAAAQKAFADAITQNLTSDGRIKVDIGASAENIVRIINEAPESARINRRPTAADTADKYGR